jgi:hypothetical protein
LIVASVPSSPTLPLRGKGVSPLSLGERARVREGTINLQRNQKIQKNLEKETS